MFGIASLSTFLSAPLTARLAGGGGGRLGPRLLCTAGALVESLTGGPAFGMLEAVGDGTTFLLLSYACR